MDRSELRDLSAFAAVARLRSFRRAAAELGVSVSSLSQQVRDLEERLDIRLLNRTTRSVAPTEAGDILLGRLAPALQEVADAVTVVRGLRETPSGRLRINAPEPAVHLVMAPMVTAFLKAHPAVELEIVVETRLIDIVAGGFDAGVRYEEHLAKDMIAVSLGPRQRYIVVGSPQLIATHGRPVTPQDLLDRPSIVTTYPNRTARSWEFEKGRRVVKLVPKGPLASTDTTLLRDAAIEGLGFLVTFEGYVRDAIADGRLVPVLEDWCPSFPGPFLYYPSRRHLPAALRAFVTFVKAWRTGQPRD